MQFYKEIRFLIGIIIFCLSAVAMQIITGCLNDENSVNTESFVDSLYFNVNLPPVSGCDQYISPQNPYLFRNTDTLIILERNVEQSYCGSHPIYHLHHRINDDSLFLRADFIGDTCMDTLVNRYLIYSFRIDRDTSFYLKKLYSDTIVNTMEIQQRYNCTN